MAMFALPSNTLTEAFKGHEYYSATATHEGAHATGRESRMKRDFQRKGRYSVLRMIEKRAAMLPLTKLAEILSSDCERRTYGGNYSWQCGPYFPD
jgi:antirestriction protein ArdC